MQAVSLRGDWRKHDEELWSAREESAKVPKRKTRKWFPLGAAGAQRKLVVLEMSYKMTDQHGVCLPTDSITSLVAL